MKVFISSLISGFDSLRDAAAGAVNTLGHEPIRAEDFPAAPGSPQAACLAGVRTSDAVVLILGERYGYSQGSGLSATHEEYREGRDTRPVMAFIQEGVAPEPKQADFIHEVQNWEKGHYTAAFRDADDLRDKVTRALHDYTMANEAAPLNEAELIERSRELLLRREQAGRPLVAVAVASGPTRAVLRPAELESEPLKNALLKEALTGDFAVLTTTAGTTTTIRGDALELRQQDADRLVRLDESGRILVVRRAAEADRNRTGISSLIQEDVAANVEASLRFCARVLDQIDPINRLTHVAPVVALSGADYMPWRTRQEQQRSPNSASMGMGTAELVQVSLSPAVRRRPALMHEAHALAEDFTVRLRREIRT